MFRIKFNIQFPFDKYGGGGNQFLQALKRRFNEDNVYIDSPARANVILFNSHHSFNQVFKLKKAYPDKIFIHRIDGPIHCVRGSEMELDKAIYRFNKIIADGTIYQSNWCKQKNKNYMKDLPKYQATILNAPDDKLFNTVGRGKRKPKNKFKLIATSNSANWRKGFGIYKFLDENLDFTKYAMTFVGNSKIDFRNIEWIRPVSSLRLAELLKEHDIYITASQNDPCSNSLIEALSCGLPAVALKDGGHPELVGKAGELFIDHNDIIDKIKAVADNYIYYKSCLPKFSIKKVSQTYYRFAEKIYDDVQTNKYEVKKLNLESRIHFFHIQFALIKRRCLGLLKTKREEIVR